MTDSNAQLVVHDIQRHRADLVADLERLRSALHARFDPREYIRAHPHAALLVAFSTGLLLRLLFHPRRRRPVFLSR
jgi:hypothetical protein